jgi:hypothetical protein
LRSEGAIQIARCRFGRGRPGLWARKTAATILKHEQAEMLTSRLADSQSAPWLTRGFGR